MKTTLIVEIETKDNIDAFEDGDYENKEAKFDATEECHDGLVVAIKQLIEHVEEELPDTFEEGYLEGADEPEDYGLKIKITKQDKDKEVTSIDSSQP